MFKKELAKSLLKIIDERNLTLESVSKATKLSRKYINNLTNEKQVASINSLEKICTALELEPNDLLINVKSKSGEKSKTMRVNTVYCKRDGGIISFVPVCPACNALLSYDWQRCCDRCGQKLGWERYTEAEPTMKKPPLKSI